jgi:hypothetical protein
MTISSIPLNISNNQTFNQQQIFINPQQIQQQQRADHILNQHINYQQQQPVNINVNQPAQQQQQQLLLASPIKTKPTKPTKPKTSKLKAQLNQLNISGMTIDAAFSQQTGTQSPIIQQSIALLQNQPQQVISSDNTLLKQLLQTAPRNATDLKWQPQQQQQQTQIAEQHQQHVLKQEEQDQQQQHGQMIGLINETHQIETQEQQLKLQFPNHTFNPQLTSPIKADDSGSLNGQKQQQQVKKRACKVKQGREDQSTTTFTVKIL